MVELLRCLQSLKVFMSDCVILNQHVGVRVAWAVVVCNLHAIKLQQVLGGVLAWEGDSERKRAGKFYPKSNDRIALWGYEIINLVITYCMIKGYNT